MWSQYLQYRMCFPFADTYGKETVVEQQMILAGDFPPFLIPFWGQNIRIVEPSRSNVLDVSEESWGLSSAFELAF